MSVAEAVLRGRSAGCESQPAGWLCWGWTGYQGRWVWDPDLAIQLSEAKGWVWKGRDETPRQGYSLPSVQDKSLVFRLQPCCSPPSRALCFQPHKKCSISPGRFSHFPSQFPNKLSVNIIEA